MELLPDRRGFIRYGALALWLLMAAVGLAVAIWFLGSVKGLFLIGPKHIPDPPTAKVLSTPKTFVRLIGAPDDPPPRRASPVERLPL